MTGTADTLCHAAWQSTYEVRELSGEDPPLDLGVRHRCDDFLDAADFVVDYLNEHDPGREGRVGELRIERVRGDAREILTAYRARDAAVPCADLSVRWGFPVTAWQGTPEARRRR